MNNNLFDKFCNEDTFFTTNKKEEYVLALVDEHIEVMRISSLKYRDLIEYRLYQAKEPINNKRVDSIIQLAKLKAKFEGEVKNVNHRIARNGKCIYYDLANDNWEMVRIAPDGWKIIEKKKVLFERYSMQKAQITPSKTGDINLLKKYISNIPMEYQLMFMVHVVLCFIPEITHAPIILQSEKGSGKTTLTTLLKRIVDPCGIYSLNLPKKVQDLFLVFRENYLANFDNVSYVSPEISDALCKGVTGAVEVRRKLYTDGDLYSFAVKNCIIFNGISFNTLRDDLTDRSIMLSLIKPKGKNKKSDTEFWSEFDKDLPRILGGIFDIISKTLVIYSDNLPKCNFRLDDYVQYGYAVAEAMGGLGNQYLKELNNNVTAKNQQLVAMNALATAIVKFLEVRPDKKYVGRPSDLLKELNTIAINEKLGINQKHWPKTAQYLSIALRKIEGILKEGENIEITFHGHTNIGSKITIEKMMS